ncbi:MAG: hypothetical protein KC589_08510, partial [Nanoarchaeota archaeon]|nr:hypothetical protein [Nanoarchaeota archaeon]
MIQKQIKIIIISLIFILGNIAAAYSATGLNVVLANQNPDPVSPGNFVELNVKVANSGDQAIKNLKIKFIENENFKIVQGKQKEKELGIIPAYSSLEGSNSYTIAKFLVQISDKTPIGENPVKFQVESELGIKNYEFDLSVLDENPIIQVNKFEIETVEAGKTAKLNVEIENINSIPLSNIVLNLDLDAVEDSILSVVTGSNQKVINNLEAREKANVEFELSIDPQAKSKPYLLPLTVNFEDSFDNSFTNKISGSVKVFSSPIILVKLDSQDIYTTGNGKATLAISNPGTSTIKGVQIEILKSDDYEVLEGDFQYIGDLNPDDFQTSQVKIHIKNPNSATLKAKVTYLDSYNKETEKMINIPLKIYNEEELKSYGIVAGGNSGGAGAGTYILALILIIVAFFIGKKI